MTNKRKVEHVQEEAIVVLSETDSDATEIIVVKAEATVSQVELSQTDKAARPQPKRLRSADQAVSSQLVTVSDSFGIGKPLPTAKSKVETTDAKPDTDKPIHPFFAKRTAASATIAGTPLTSIAPVKWSSLKSILIATYLTQPHLSRIAAFDFDGTIVTVRGGHVHAKNAEDWMFFHPSIPDRLISLHYDEGYRIVIFSNQKGIDVPGSGSKRKASFMGRVENVIKAIQNRANKLGVTPPPILVFGSTGDDWNRKPRPGMWETFETDWNGGVVVDRGNSFYVGDAAGRGAGHKAGAKKDFADTDHKFALNVGCKFYTPEAFFHFNTVADLEAAQLPPVHGSHHAPHPPFDPRQFLQDQEDKPLYTPEDTPLIPLLSQRPEVVLFIGSPASGKSSFARRHLLPKGYVHINQDTLKTREKCVKACEEALNQRKSAVIDNTNPERATRQLYIEIAKRVGKRLGKPISVRCFWFRADEQLCLHNNVYRELIAAKTTPDEEVPLDQGKKKGQKKSQQGQPARVPTMAFRNFAARLQPPDEDEGFDEIKEINFKPEFAIDEERKLWELFYV